MCEKYVKNKVQFNSYVPGSSLVALHGSKEPLHPFILYQAGYAYDGAIREGDWVLTVNRENKAMELYNLSNDLAQENNLIDHPEYRKLIDRLRTKFLKYNDHKNETWEPRTTEAFRINS